MSQMRLDRFLSECGVTSRSEAVKAIRLGAALVDGVPRRDPGAHIDPEKANVCFRGEPVIYRRFTYIMLNKPAGAVSATRDPKEKTVTELLPPPLQKQGLFPCGRLDKDTLGLLILTNDGEAAHRKLSPRRHAEKIYRFELAEDLPEETRLRLEGGVMLEDGLLTAPCRIVMQGEKSGEITLTEGKYHEIKRLFGSAGNRVTGLERIAFAGIRLDESLPRGGWRFLTPEEEALLKE